MVMMRPSLQAMSLRATGGVGKKNTSQKETLFLCPLNERFISVHLLMILKIELIYF